MLMARPDITEKERAYVERALARGDIGVGEFIPQFESAWAKWNHREYGVSCNSGTNALYLALKAIGVGPGDEVIVPEYTMIATAWAVSYTGATPVFADCEDDLLVHEWPITERTKAVIVVPIYGRSAPHPEGITVIEDMAEAHGIKPTGKIACYSFYGNKILATGEGGMCLTDDEELAEEMRNLANIYMDKRRTMLHPKLGYNFRLTNIQAAIGVGQVQRAGELLAARKQVERWYDQALPENLKMPERDVVWMYDIQTERQEELKEHLKENGIESRYGFKPMSMQPIYGRPYEHLNAYRWSKRILYLPTYPELTENEVQMICQTIRSFDENRK